jgi:hypothetical protein
VNGQPLPGDGGEGEPCADDLPRRLLSAAVACASAGREGWGQAMLAELDQVAGYCARWRFALGAARAVLVPPARSRPAAALLAAGTASTAIASRLLVPEAGLATVAVPVIAGLFALIALLGPHQPRPASPVGRAAQVVVTAGIAACFVLAMRQFALFPSQEGGRGGPVVAFVMTVLFGVELGAYLLLVLRRPGLLGAGRHSGLLGLGAVLAAGCASVAYPRPGPQSGFPVLSPAYLGMMIGASLAAGALAALPGLLLRRCLRCGLRSAAAEVLWGLVFSGPAAFVGALLTISHSAVALQAKDPATITYADQRGVTSVQAWVAGDDLGGSLMLLTFLTGAIVAAVSLLAQDSQPEA